MTRRNSGFTLIEILIVVVILGILAAIVIPQFTNASETAKGSNLVSQLQTVRSQLELYQVQHNGNYPVTDGLIDWTLLTSRTDVNGGAVDAGETAFGPYLQKAPQNPFIADATSTSVAAAVADGVAWVWDNDAKFLKATCPAASIDKAGLTDNDDIEPIAAEE
ncbi:MAG: prepilin-type N-terminal cleavage/methylation domain-containing protein [Phycisphaeraceae bacterium]|nr:prepilin-type N-terminal cleavage/methylation domain-containing protein [Phycisphaeraceae bacterium]